MTSPTIAYPTALPIHTPYMDDHIDETEIHITLIRRGHDTTVTTEQLDNRTDAYTTQITDEVDDHEIKLDLSHAVGHEIVEAMMPELERRAREEGMTLDWYDPPETVEEDLPPHPDDEQEDIQDTATD